MIHLDNILRARHSRTKTCECGATFTRHHLAKFCFPCTVKRARGCSRRHAEIHDRQAHACQVVARAVAVGHLPRLPSKGIDCVDCGKSAKHYDHRDYLFPLLIAPVCISCNLLRGPGKNSSSDLRPDIYPPGDRHDRRATERRHP